MRVRDFFLFAIVVVFGVLISVLPHLDRWQSTRDITWIADNNELELYLPTAAQAAENNWFFNGDPVFSDQKPTVYPWTQIMPGVWLAEVFGGGYAKIGFAWRLIAGLSISIAWLVLFFWGFRLSALAAAFCALILLGDLNGIYGKLFARHFSIFFQSLSSSNESSVALVTLLGQWRIITPGLSLASLLIFFATYFRARETGHAKAILAAGISLGALFHIYFYYWTFAVFGIFLNFILDVFRRDKKAIFATIFLSVLGAVIGIFALWQNFVIKQASGVDWLQRSDKFIAIGRTQELLLPFGSFLLLVLAFFVDRKFESRYRPLIIFIAGGFFLLNHQLVSGLQIENFHWNYAFGPFLAALSILLLLEFAKRLPLISKNWRLCVLLATVGIFIHSGSALWLRLVEGRTLPDSAHALMNRANYHVEKADPGFPVLEKNSVIAGAPKFVNFAVLEENLRILSGYSVVLSPGIRNLEWDLRVALNAFLSGMSAAEFLAEQEAFFNSTHWGPWVRNPELKKQRLIEREAAFASIAAAPLEAIAMFKVRYVFLAPDATLQNLSPLWSQKLYSGTHFQVLQLKL